MAHDLLVDQWCPGWSQPDVHNRHRDLEPERQRLHPNASSRKQDHAQIAGQRTQLDEDHGRWGGVVPRAVPHWMDCHNGNGIPIVECLLEGRSVLIPRITGFAVPLCWGRRRWCFTWLLDDGVRHIRIVALNTARPHGHTTVHPLERSKNARVDNPPRRRLRQ